MRIGIPIMQDNGLESEVSEHFGRSSYFILIDLIENWNAIGIENLDSSISKVTIVENMVKFACEAIVDLLMNVSVDILVVGGIGGNPAGLLRENGVKIYGGARGTILKVLKEFMNGELPVVEFGSCKP